jgi:hypothetical protein
VPGRARRTSGRTELVAARSRTGAFAAWWHPYAHIRKEIDGRTAQTVRLPHAAGRRVGCLGSLAPEMVGSGASDMSGDDRRLPQCRWTGRRQPQSAHSAAFLIVIRRA